MLLAAAACFFGAFWFLGEKETKCTPEYEAKSSSAAEPEIKVRILKSEREIMFFHPLPDQREREKDCAKIIDKVNEAAEQWQKENPDVRVRDITIEHRDYPRIYGISLWFQSPRKPWEN